MPQFFFVCHPWDLDGEGIEPVLSRIAGEIGVDAVSAAAVHHGVRELRPRAAQGPRIVDLPAGAHFQPDSSRYVNTRVRPLVAPWLKSRNPLEKIARGAEQAGLKLRVSVCLCRNPGLGAKYPMTRCANVFGDESRERLCPSNPEVREYAVALAEDLTTNYPAHTLELADFDFGDGRDLTDSLEPGVLPGEAERTLWSWCFCPACRQRASDCGVAAEKVVEKVRGHLQRMLHLEPPLQVSFETLMGEDPLLSAYHAMRQETVLSLLRAVRARAKGRLLLQGPAAPPLGSVPASMLSPCCDGFLVRFAEDRGRTDGRGVPVVVGQAGGASRIEVWQYCCPPYVKEGPALVAATQNASNLGFAGIGFFNYGLAPETCLDWVRQAVRYARRNSPCG